VRTPLFGVGRLGQLRYRGLRSSLFVLGALTAATLLPLPAMAFSFLGFTLFEDQNALDADAVIADPQPYTVDFQITGGDETVENNARNASALWDGRDRVASGAAGLLASARTDYRRIVAALYAEGYYGGTVSINVDGTEATDLPPDADLADPAIVLVRVNTGPQFTFGTLTVDNQANVDENAFTDTGFSTGAIARAGAVRRAARISTDAWRREGYAKAKVANQDIVADHNSKRVNVTLTIAPGARATIGAITVEGTRDMKPDFVARQTGLVAGEQYSPKAITRARERLTDLGVFTAVKIVEADTIAADGSLPLNVIVQERAARRIGAGATFSTTDGLGLETFWLHRNLFGEGENLRLDAKLAGIAFPIDTADFDYYFGGTFTKPGLFTPDTSLVSSLIAQRTVLTRYTETSIEGRLGLSHKFSPQLSVDGGIAAKRANFFDEAYGDRDFTVLGAYGGATFDSRNSTTDATEGLYANLTLEPFYELEYGNGAALVTAEARTYFGFGENDRFVLAGRVKVGALLGPDISETPPDKLFFAGGGGSVRGFSYRAIGVDGPGGSVTGGKFLTEASIEARAKITENIGVVGFVDAGYVTADSFTGLADGTRIGIGGGLRYYTGFGPLRLDVAVPVNKRAGDPDYALYVGIGQAF